MLTADQLLSICCNYAGDGYYVGELIPRGKLDNFRREMGSLALPAESVIALLDCTLFGSNKEGVAICTNGVYWNNNTARPHKGRLSWEELARGPIQKIGYHEVQIGAGKAISLAGCGFPVDTFAWLLQDIQTALLRGSADEARAAQQVDAPPLPTAQQSDWRLALSGTQCGWYSTETIRSLVAANHIDPADAMVWKPGLAAWQPLQSVPELSGLQPVPGTVPCPSCGYENEETDRFCGGCGTPLPKGVNTPATVVAPVTSPSPAPETAGSGRIDLNAASVDALLVLPGITLASATRLVGERAKRGGFATLEEVGELLHLQPHEVERLRRFVAFHPYTAPSSGASRIDVNRASESELARLPGIGPVYAKKAIGARTRNGAFASIDQFAATLNLPPHVVERLRQTAVAEPVERPPSRAPGKRVVDY